MSSKKRDGLSCSESGKLGYEKSREKLQKHLEQRKKECLKRYELNPKFCENCGKKIPYEKKGNKYCDHTCRALLVNRTRKRKDARKAINCAYCGKETKNLQYCSNKCQGSHKSQLCFDRYEKTGEVNSKNDATIRQFLRRYLLDRREHICEICKNTKWMGSEIPLLVDHINGDPSNHNRKNLRLICGNCNMNLSTFAGRNRGNGRKCRRDFYKKNGYC